MKALVDAFNQEKALAGAFSVIVKTDCETDGSIYSTTLYSIERPHRRNERGEARVSPPSLKVAIRPP